MPAAVVALFVVGVVVQSRTNTPASMSSPAAAAPSALRGSKPPPGIVAPDFTLDDAQGGGVSMRALRGRVAVVTFLDSKCHEACPVIAGVVTSALRRLAPGERKRVVALAVSTSPADDTRASVRAFLRRHHALGELHYLIGSERRLRPVWNAFHILSSVDSGNSDVHSASVRVFDGRGVWVSSLSPGVDLTVANLANDVRVALRPRRA